MTLKENPTREELLYELSSRGLARIAVQIQSLWDSDECYKYLDSLIIDYRGAREGFRDGTFRIIIQLYTMYCFEHNLVDRWCNVFVQKPPIAQ